MRLFKPFIIPLLFVFGYLILISYPYFFSKINLNDSLGALSLVEERSEEIKQVGKTNNLFAKEKITGGVISSENNFGILLVRFLQVSPKVKDRVIFRIKEVGDKKWYYENTYPANQFQSNQYFTFGFPEIADSKNKQYIFEIESLSGTEKNGVGLSPEKPQVALVYRFTKESLTSVDIFSFIFKKFIYILENANFWQEWPILISALIIYFMIKEKNTKKKKSKLANRVIKIIVKFLKKVIRSFTTTQLYLMFLNTKFKKRLAIVLVLFLFAFLYRFSATLVDQSSLYPFYRSLGNGVGINSFYSLLGNGGDYDQFIRAATCAVKSFCPAILGQNFLIESSILGVFYEIFGFTGGLKTYLYLMIVLSSIVATLPYLLLSQKNWFTIGGIIGSLFLASSDYLAHMAINLPPDNLSLFFFSIFFVVYLLTLHRGTIRLLLLFGILGTIDGLNKLFLLVNDLVVFILFAPVFFLEKVTKITKFPFIQLNLKLLFYSLVPFLVFLVIYSLWEYIVQIRFGVPYYLRAFIESSGSTYVSRSDVASDSINIFSRGIVDILYYYAGLTIVMQKRIIDYAGLSSVFLVPIFIGLLFATFKRSESKTTPVSKRIFRAKLFSVVVFSIIVFILLVLFKQNFGGIQEIGIYVYAWPDNHYTNIFLFSSIIFLCILNFNYRAFKFALPILPYSIILIILTKNAPWGRMWVHVIVWSVILLSFLVDWMLHQEKKEHVFKKMWVGPLLLSLFILFYIMPKTWNMVEYLYTGITNSWNESTYLRWVNTELPKNAIILAGGKSDLVTITKNVNSPSIYNTQWTGALLIKPNEMPGVSPSDWNIVEELRNKDNFKEKKYVILEDDMELWRSRKEGVVDNLFATTSATFLKINDYEINVYKFNSVLNKGIYELTFIDK